MRVIRFLRCHPIAVFGAGALAFAAWLYFDTGGTSSDPSLVSPAINPTSGATIRRRLPMLDEGGTDRAEKARPTPRETAQVLPKLKPGMTRAEVEGLVGVPDARDIHPVQVFEGRVIYHTTYEIDLDPPQTVRPIRPMPKTPKAVPRDRTLITLEFDATQPGHPLLGILYPDPLF
jgi:hypothetical protein